MINGFVRVRRGGGSPDRRRNRRAADAAHHRRWDDQGVTPHLVNVDDVYAARELLRGIVRTTPVEPCRPLSAKLAGPVWL